MTIEKKKLNKSNNNYTNSLAAYNCNSCTQTDMCNDGKGGANYTSNANRGQTLQLPYWRM